MSILSESISETHASDLEGVLLKAIDGCNMKVLTFCQLNVYPLYKKYNDSGYSISKNENIKKIQKVFGK